MPESLSPVQEAILSFFAEHDIWAKPATIAANIDYTRNYASRECKNLARMGYLDAEPGPIYSLSDRGRDYLAGDLDE
jgi:predicted transcriptional regulator